jgi:hypothetical protein
LSLEKYTLLPHKIRQMNTRILFEIPNRARTRDTILEDKLYQAKSLVVSSP